VCPNTRDTSARVLAVSGEIDEAEATAFQDAAGADLTIVTGPGNRAVLRPLQVTAVDTLFRLVPVLDDAGPDGQVR
jgi:hypothetical protein